MHNEEKEKNELILRLALKNKYKWIGFLARTIFSMLIVWYTYKAHTNPPTSFHTIKGWAFFYLFGPFFSYLFLLITIHGANARYIEIYNNKIIQRVFIKWLPPFEKVVHFKPDEMKFKIIYYNKGYYCIAFYNSDKDLEVFLSLEKILHSPLYKKVICIGINPSLKLFKIFHLRYYEKSKLLKLIDILMENCKNENDKQLLEKLKQEVLAWKDK
jgi:hypothetical protein